MILREMTDVINDDALFTQRTRPDDAPVGEPPEDEEIEEGSDCGCGCGGAPGGCGGGKSGTVKATVLFVSFASALRLPAASLNLPLTTLTVPDPVLGVKVTV